MPCSSTRASGARLAAMLLNRRLPLLVLAGLSQVTAHLLSRRAVLRLGAIAASGVSPLLPSSALAGGLPADRERQRLLDAIKADRGVEEALLALLPLDPSGGRGAVEESLGGSWRLLWSAGADKFSPLLSLPRPIRPASRQLLGAPATALVGEGRVAQLLDFPLDTSIILSSGTRPAEGGDGSLLEIFPPFRLEVSLLGGAARTTVVEAGSDAEFRALNARDETAQQAPRNIYQQRYLEPTGRSGALRISEVIAGDPVIVGSIFVHERLP